MDTSMRPCFALADAARQALIDGRPMLAMQLMDQARITWNPEDTPTDENGQPELFWPFLWEGSAMTLGLLPDTRLMLPLLDPPLQRLLDSLHELT